MAALVRVVRIFPDEELVVGDDAEVLEIQYDDGVSRGGRPSFVILLSDDAPDEEED